MAIFSAVMTTMLLVVLHVSPVRGVTMAARDKTALMAVRAAIVNKEVFPAIQCGPKLNDPFGCDKSGRVISVDISYLGLEGRISAEIAKLNKLKYLSLSSNAFKGSIPYSIGNLTTLQNLDLSLNKLSGSIPWSIGQLKSLKSLYLYNNQLSGSIPWSIIFLKSLNYIALRYNQLSGSIPSSICNLTSLIDVDLSYNKLSGIIPSSIGNLKSLINIRLANNTLTGRIPSSISQIKSLSDFYVANNYITGPNSQVRGIPYCFELKGNCLFGSNLPLGCASSDQRSKSTCLSFCNALQKGGPCGGHGICSIGKDGKTSTCACNKGYNNKASKYTCK